MASVFTAPPARIERVDVTVMQRTVTDDLPAIRAAWPAFEALVGLPGRRMYARVDPAANRYSVCTPIRAIDDPERFGLETAVLSGGVYLRGRILGEAPQSYALIADGMDELAGLVPRDASRPLVEYYRRADEIELWLPVHDRATG